MNPQKNKNKNKPLLVAEEREIKESIPFTIAPKNINTKE